MSEYIILYADIGTTMRLLGPAIHFMCIVSATWSAIYGLLPLIHTQVWIAFLTLHHHHHQTLVQTATVPPATHASPTTAWAAVAALPVFPFGVVEFLAMISQLTVTVVCKCSTVATQLFARPVVQSHATTSVQSPVMLATCVSTTLTSTAAALMAIQCGVAIILATHRIMCVARHEWLCNFMHVVSQRCNTRQLYVYSFYNAPKTFEK